MVGHGHGFLRLAVGISAAPRRPSHSEWARGFGIHVSGPAGVAIALIIGRFTAGNCIGKVNFAAAAAAAAAAVRAAARVVAGIGGRGVRALVRSS
jgi:hypothetical protein